MATKIAVISQKGGVGKSTTARLIAGEYASSDWRVKIADFDLKQGTCVKWKLRREQNSLEPAISVETFRTVSQAIKIENNYDLLILDGQPHSSSLTLEMARASDYILLPTGLSRDDLEPTILLAHELTESGIKNRKMAIILCRVGDSELEISEAQTLIKKAGYITLNHHLPEKIGYRRASDAGKTLSEASNPHLKDKAEKFAQSIVDFVSNN